MIMRVIMCIIDSHILSHTVRSLRMSMLVVDECHVLLIALLLWHCSKCVELYDACTGLTHCCVH